MGFGPGVGVGVGSGVTSLISSTVVIIVVSSFFLMLSSYWLSVARLWGAKNSALASVALSAGFSLLSVVRPFLSTIRFTVSPFFRLTPCNAATPKVTPFRSVGLGLARIFPSPSTKLPSLSMSIAIWPPDADPLLIAPTNSVPYLLNSTDIPAIAASSLLPIIFSSSLKLPGVLMVSMVSPLAISLGR